MPGRPKPWDRLERETVYDARIFTVHRHRSRSPRTGGLHDFHVIESCDWVNIVPLTPAREVVMVTQYRHGIERLTLEVPGGMVDPEDSSPLVAARREMREETGYDTDDVVPLGTIHPNPAIQSNVCHTFLARNAVPTAPVAFDGTEETHVVLVPLERVPDLILDGTITHALVVVAFHWLGLRETGGMGSEDPTRNR
jgi:8-oxo-dGTP pyrophosphatase MutT (NUDIX family)